MCAPTTTNKWKWGRLLLFFFTGLFDADADTDAVPCPMRLRWTRSMTRYQQQQQSRPRAMRHCTLLLLQSSSSSSSSTAAATAAASVNREEEKRRTDWSSLPTTDADDASNVEALSQQEAKEGRTARTSSSAFHVVKCSEVQCNSSVFFQTKKK